MSISSSLAHKYDEFDEFSQPSAPKSAYEELKAWCEKHLKPEDYEIMDGIKISLKDFEVEEFRLHRKVNIFFRENGEVFQRQTIIKESRG